MLSKFDLFKIRNSNNIEVWITNYGATIISIITPDKNNSFSDIVLGFDHVNDYMKSNNPYFGATCGRYANRIKNSTFSIDGKIFLLDKNDGKHSLHGGEKGFDKEIWNTEYIKNNSISMELFIPDGQGGYPGNLKVKTIFEINNQNQLKISYLATSDKTTVINLTNHSYFNLSGSGSILNHEIKIHSNNYIVVDDEAIPTGEIREVKGTEMDLRSYTPIGKKIQKVQGLGYDHNFCINNFNGKLQLAAEVYDPNSGRTLKCLTTEPGIQFYTGNFLNALCGKNGCIYEKHHGFCLETQHYPDSPNNDNFPSTLLSPGETYESICIYQFGIKNAD